MKNLRIKGIKVHNLRNIDVSIPLERITVITGLSGSGKSSLVFDTIYAESSRRFIESLGAFNRIYLPRLPAPEIESAENMPPAIAVRYLPLSRSSRSTVGTSTEIYDYLRLLFANIGETWCSECGIKIEPLNSSQAADILIRAGAGKTAVITFSKNLEHQNFKDFLESISSKGFFRIFRNGAIEDISSFGKYKKEKTFEVIIDRLIVKERERTRIAEAVETAYKEGNGICRIFFQDAEEEPLVFTEGRTCINCGRFYPLPSAGMFSFNSLHGACPECKGFGDIITYDLEKIIPDKRKTFNEGAVPVLELNRFNYVKYNILNLLKRNGISPDIPVSFIRPKDLEIIWKGDEESDGLLGFFKTIERKRYRVDIRAILAKYRSYLRCPACRGSRLRPEAMNVKVDGIDIGKSVEMPISELLQFIKRAAESYKSNKAALEIFSQINRRITMLVNVGVGYLTLNRMTRTLSRGELQRINLINAAGAGLTGSLYLMDEPSVGLHPMDEDGLMEIVDHLKEQGNTVVIAEHSAAMIKKADYIIELGPKAGEDGGSIVFEGMMKDFISADTITSKYIQSDRSEDIPEFRRTGTREYIKIRRARANNLKNLDIDIPSGVLTCITGPSGAGKSSLIMDVLYGYWRKTIMNDVTANFGECGSIEGLGDFEDVISIEGGRISLSPRSCVATFIGVFAEIRKHFAELRTSKAAGLQPKDFSFNTRYGRCPECEGRGKIIVDLQFLPDVSVVCERCRGSRYREAPLEHRFLGKNIFGILDQTVEKSMEIFKGKDKINSKLRLLDDIGLGYLKLGQPLDTLSSGEASRLALARIIGRKEMSGRLFLFDEPSIGLHPFNVSKLLRIFTRMLANNATIICIEHNLDIIKAADYVIDMGPGGGDKGGNILAAGTPEEIAANEISVTGRYLRAILEKERRSPVGKTVYNGYQITR